MENNDRINNTLKPEQSQAFVNMLLKQMYDRRGTDLYVLPQAPPNLRINNQLVPVGKTITSQNCDLIIRALLAPHQIEELEKNRNVNFAWPLPGYARFRANAYYQRGSLGMVMRYIPNDIPAFNTLNLPLALHDLALVKRGLILIVGAAGQGKSTTMASMLQRRNETTTGHIITVEDPIEFTYSHKRSLVSQREVGFDAVSFSDALRGALRQSPDVIAVGEIRDEESMRLAMSIADTGHLCIASLHASTTTQAIERIIHLFDESQRTSLLHDLATNLRTIIAQRLIQVDEETMRPVVEVMHNTSTIAHLIRENKIEEIRPYISRGGEQGMMVFDDGIFGLYQQGLISEDKALLNADAVNDLRLRIRLGNGIEENSNLDFLG